MPEGKQASSWWNTLPGVIAALAGLVTAIGGLLLALHTLGFFEKPKTPVDQPAAKQAEPKTIPNDAEPKAILPKKAASKKPPIDTAGSEAKPASYSIPGTNRAFVEKDGHLASTENGNPLCPTPPGLRTGCYALEQQYRQNWRNTPDGYIANGRKVKTFANRSERIFEILGSKHAFYVDDGYLFEYYSAAILCPWPRAGVGKCQAIEPQYEAKWHNTPSGFIADGKVFDRDEVMRQVRLGLF